MGEVLSRRALNRATLDRQLLLRRAPMDAAQAVEHLVGLQTQVPHNHYTALWSRLENFDPEDFSARFERREFVRLGLLRGTIHTVTARDALALRPVFQMLLTRVLKSSFGKPLAGVDLEAAAERARVLVEDEPLTFSEIGKRLLVDWPDSQPQALGMVARHLLAMVQVPPRGLWQQGGLSRHTTLQHWLGADLPADATPDDLVMRYFAAFGPASVSDVQSWSGLTRLAEVVERHRGELVVFLDENGVELFDLPDAPRPGEDVPAPARFLPEFDNVFIGHRDRSRIVSDQAAQAVWLTNVPYPVFLSDGFIQGTWSLALDKKRTHATLTVKPFAALPADQREALEREGAALLDFHAPGAGHEINWGVHGE
ncbi:winged helix DNA-binding domain-containing protein [Actinomadura rudentiformis]|uniref:Winged helix DNA-binding domain-containing protein n=1 Tax=Actinomadura rudentiformis TaxID=359158 RepID=A0A6H9YPG3_9ACTN|nr:winged helix DNA-binding domain-containing protein [Actinomadura rudentiformis]KAB2340993.1 winged helix DNA-binding domain-containing protein [Actinomadura rudentiformis]